MKALITLFFMAVSVSLCNAQYVSVDTPIFKTVRLDTINIHGIVYDACDNPVRGAFVVSQNKEISYEGLPVYAATGRDGKFTLKGALLLDTLAILATGTIRVVNKGSRYLELHLPFVSENADNIDATVHARRAAPKNGPATFKVLTNAQVLDYFGVGGTSAAHFPGGRQKFMHYVTNLVKYPQDAIAHNIEGEVEIGFSVERDGSAGDFHVMRGIGYGCEDAVINAIKSSPKWSPAFLNGTPYSAKESVTFEFKLDDK